MLCDNAVFDILNVDLPVLLTYSCLRGKLQYVYQATC